MRGFGNSGLVFPPKKQRIWHEIDAKQVPLLDNLYTGVSKVQVSLSNPSKQFNKTSF